jgi:hypothetical protein
MEVATVIQGRQRIGGERLERAPKKHKSEGIQLVQSAQTFGVGICTYVWQPPLHENLRFFLIKRTLLITTLWSTMNTEQQKMGAAANLPNIRLTMDRINPVVDMPRLGGKAPLNSLQAVERRLEVRRNV